MRRRSHFLVVVALAVVSACGGGPAPLTPTSATLISVFCGIDTCQSIANYHFTGIASAEPDTTRVWGGDAPPFVEGDFTLTVAVDGDGASTGTIFAEDFSASYVLRGEAIEWRWEDNGRTCFRTSLEEEPIDSTGAYDCARIAFEELGLGFVGIEVDTNRRVAIRTEPLIYVEEAETRRIHEHESIERYGPFHVWNNGDGLIEAGPTGHVRWLTSWSDGTQWTLVLF